MQKAAGLLSKLGDLIDVIKCHVSSMDDRMLKELASSLPSRAPAGSAEMLMLLLVYREMEGRERQPASSNILPFPSAAKQP